MGSVRVQGIWAPPERSFIWTNQLPKCQPSTLSCSLAYLWALSGPSSPFLLLPFLSVHVPLSLEESCWQVSCTGPPVFIEMLCRWKCLWACLSLHHPAVGRKSPTEKSLSYSWVSMGFSWVTRGNCQNKILWWRASLYILYGLCNNSETASFMSASLSDTGKQWSL